jgi:hypothetical protein
MRAGKRKLRIRGQPPPCNRCPKIPLEIFIDGEPRPCPPFPRYAIELSAKNKKALEFHYRCRVTGRWSDDRIVLRNAGLIEKTEQEIRDEREQRTATLLQSFVQMALLRIK